MNARISAVTIPVRELFRAQGFYGPVFGWPVLSRSDDHLELELSGGQRITLRQVPAGEPLAPVEIELVVPDLELLRTRLNATEGIPSDGSVEAWRDPDGNVIRLVPLQAGPAAPIERDEFIGRIADVLRRSGTGDAEALIRGLEASVHFPVQAKRCGKISTMYAVTCIRPPEHDGYCEGPHGERWTRVG